METTKESRTSESGTVTFSQALDLGEAEIVALSAETITRMSHGIRFFDFDASPIAYTREREAALRQLQARLAIIQAATKRPEAAVPMMVDCDCGHTISSGLLMEATRGTCCPDCYDRMSD